DFGRELRPDRLGHRAAAGDPPLDGGLVPPRRSPARAHRACRTAIAMHPTPSPAKPRPSGRVAFTETRPPGRPRAGPRFPLIASVMGAIGGFSAITVRSQEDAANPASRASETTRPSKLRPAIPSVAG